MRKRIRSFSRICAIALALVALVVLTGGVHAEGPDLDDPEVVKALIEDLAGSADPSAAYLRLSPTEQEAVVKGLSVAYVESTTTVVRVSPTAPASENEAAGSASVECSVNRHSETYKSWLRITMWTFTTETSWCYDGTLIVNTPHFTTDGEIGWNGVFWSYEGTTDEGETGGRGQTYHRDSAEGHFKYCVPRAGCIEHKYPDIHKAQFGDGESTAYGST